MFTFRHFHFIFAQKFPSRYNEVSKVHVFFSCSLPKLGSWIFYDIKEAGKIRESKETCAKDWIDVGLEIAENYSKYDGFVILHGTDTMAYTASALSFMLENLGKPVVLTGAQVI